MRSLWLILIPLVLVGGCTGRIIKESLGTVTGPKGAEFALRDVSSQSPDVSLEEYTEFRMEPFRDDFGGKVPTRLIERLPAAFARELAERKIRSHEGGKTLIIRGRIIHFELATAKTSHLFGPFEEVVARVELVDGSSGEVLGVANCVGRSGESVNQGVDKKTQGLASGIAGWIADHYPKKK